MSNDAKVYVLRGNPTVTDKGVTLRPNCLRKNIRVSFWRTSDGRLCRLDLKPQELMQIKHRAIARVSGDPRCRAMLKKWQDLFVGSGQVSTDYAAAKRSLAFLFGSMEEGAGECCGLLEARMIDCIIDEYHRLKMNERGCTSKPGMGQLVAA